MTRSTPPVHSRTSEVVRRAAALVRSAALLALLASGAASAQAPRLPAQATASVVYQQILDDALLGDSTGLRQVAVPLVVLAPVAPGVDLSLRASYASTSRDGAEAASGFTDAHLALSVRQAVGGGEVAVGLAATVPAGSGLTREAAATAFLAAQDFYAFAAPSLRSGPSLSPSVSVAVPAGAALVVGGGVAYRLRTGFEPRADLDASFDPGNEVTVTAGLDALLSDGSTFALDGLYVRYGTDTFGDLEYGTGDAFGLSATWSGLVGTTPVSVFGAARQKAGSDVDRATRARLGSEAAVPTQGRLGATAHVRLGPLPDDGRLGGRPVLRRERGVRVAVARRPPRGAGVPGLGRRGHRGAPGRDGGELHERRGRARAERGALAAAPARGRDARRVAPSPPRPRGRGGR